MLLIILPYPLINTSRTFTRSGPGPTWPKDWVSKEETRTDPKYLCREVPCYLPTSRIGASELPTPGGPLGRDRGHSRLDFLDKMFKAKDGIVHIACISHYMASHAT